MKMRQKLAAVLAASMVLTAMPVLTLAKSDFSITTGIQVRDEDEKVTTNLKIEMKDTTTEAFIFFVELDKAEFTEKQNKLSDPLDVIDGGKTVPGLDVRYTITGDKEMKVEVTPNNKKGTFEIPLKEIKLKGGDATVSVSGASSVIGDMSPIVFARTSGADATVKVDDPESIYKEQKTVAKITVEEPYADALEAGKKIEFTVKHADYEIVSCKTNLERGFSLQSGKTKADLDNLFDVDSDGNATFKFDTNVIKRDSRAAGRMTFELVLRSTEKKPSTGKLNIKVSGDKIDDKTITVAEVKDYGTTIEMKDKKVVDITAGGSSDITFTVKESVAKTFAAGREFDVEFDKGFLSPIEDMNKTQELEIIKNLQKAIDDDFDSKDVKNLQSDDCSLEVTDLIYNDDDYAVGFTVMIHAIKDDLDGALEMEMKDVKVYQELGYTGDVKVKVSGRALGYDAETVAVNAKKAVEIKAEPITIKVGLKSQLGGKVEIKEADKGIFEQGEYLILKLDEDETGLKLKDAKAKVTSGDLQIDEDNLKFFGDNSIGIKVKRSSDEASTITLTDIEIYSDRTVPQGSYSLNIGGRAVAADWTLVPNANGEKTAKVNKGLADIETSKSTALKDMSMVKSLEVKDFVVVGTPNTEDITTANGLRKGTASFVIGSTKYVVNGKEAEMPVAAYTENGRTMIPVRFVANALGIDDTEITYAKGTANVIVGSKMYSFKIGEKVAYINGMPARTMLTAPVLKNDRCFVPVAELGELLGAEMKWDAATQTATFTVK